MYGVDGGKVDPKVDWKRKKEKLKNLQSPAKSMDIVDRLHCVTADTHTKG
jgi:hypothetical protein